jgi:uncharacterized repeat protein (TIGR03803 family)
MILRRSTQDLKEGSMIRQAGYRVILTFAVLIAVVSAAEAQETVLYRFKGGRDGTVPMGGLIMDAHGVLYGTTERGGKNATCANCGTVFALTPPPADQSIWVETVLHRFHGLRIGGSRSPASGLIMDARGALYGTTSYGGIHGCRRIISSSIGKGCGTVFVLTPPAPGATFWHDKLLYRFKGRGGKDGSIPSAGLFMDGQGVLYGTTSYGGGGLTGCNRGWGCGTAFALTPPVVGETRWSEQVLHSFDGTDGRMPQSALLMDGVGNLYGTSREGGLYDKGTVFELMPPAASGTDWTLAILHNFGGGKDGNTPSAGLIMDARGILYGTTPLGGDGSCRCGTVFALSPPPAGGSQWTETVLHSFTDSATDGGLPLSELTLGANGVLYGTTQEGGGGGVNGYGPGTVFALAPPAAGTSQWTETLLYRFRGGTDGATPVGGLIADANGVLYGTTVVGGTGCPDRRGCGTVFKVIP